MNISNLLQLNKCTVLPQSSTPTKDGNSIFTSIPPLRINDLFSDTANVELSANYVHISGYDNEPMHHHISHVVGVIIKGSAYLQTDEGNIPVQQGDVVVVPKGIKHEFICDDGKEMDYMAYEIANISLDFNKHF
mgnify:CR=1